MDRITDIAEPLDRSGLVSTPLSPKGTAISYDGSDLDAMARAANYREWILSGFDPYFGNVVGEVGAGKGDVSASILARGVGEFHALEPSPEMYPHLVKRLSSHGFATPHPMTLPEIGCRYIRHFDSLVYVNVLEHIEDDERELQQAWNCLRPGGHLCLFVPALTWLYSDFDASLGHFRRYEAKPLEALLTRCGFTVVTLRYFDILGIIPWLLTFRVMKRRLAGRQVAAYDRWVVPGLRRVEALIRVPVGKSLLLVGRK